MDVYSGYTLVRRLEDKSGPEITRVFGTMVGELPFVPITLLLTDGGGEFSDLLKRAGIQQLSECEPSLFDHITFCRRITTSSYNPQGNGKLERMHAEMVRFCAIHFTTPDRLALYLNPPAVRSLFFASAADSAKRFLALKAQAADLAEAARAWADRIVDAVPSALPPPTTPLPLDRTFRLGDSVLARQPPRSRKKTDPTYIGPFEVVKFHPPKSYSVSDGVTASRTKSKLLRYSIDFLKLYVPPCFTYLTFDRSFLAETLHITKGTIMPPFPELFHLRWTDASVFAGFLCSEWPHVLAHATAHAPCTLYGILPYTRGIKACRLALDAPDHYPQCTSVTVTPMSHGAIQDHVTDARGEPTQLPSVFYFTFAGLCLKFSAPPAVAMPAPVQPAPQPDVPPPSLQPSPGPP